MKKVFYSIGLVSVMMFSACTEDKGTSYETADANQDENVDRNQIRGYGENETAADMSMRSGDMAQGTGEEAWRANSERIASQMATDLQLDNATQTKVQQVLLERERRLGELQGNYNYSETNRMGGQVAEDVDNTATSNRDKMDTDGGTMTDIQANTTDLNAERELILADTDRELRAVLTPEQFTQYEQNRVNYSGMGSDNNNSNNESYNSGSMRNSGQNQTDNNNQMKNNNSGNRNNNQSGTNSNTNSGNRSGN